MEIKYTKEIIMFITHNNKDVELISPLKPYVYGTTGHKFTVPVTLFSLNEIVTKLGIPQDEQYYELLWHLETSLLLTQSQFNASHDPDLRPYQYQGVAWLLYTLKEYGAAGLFWDPRVGKTRTTVKATNDFHKVIVMSLAGQEDNWVSNYKDYSEHSVVLSLHKKSKEKRKEIYKQFYEDSRIVIVGSINTISSDALDPIMGYHLRGSRIDVLVLDEIHKIQNKKTRLHKGSELLRKISPNVIGLTGTPVSKNASDVINIMSFLFPKFNMTFLRTYFFELAPNFYGKGGLATVVKDCKKQEWVELLSLMFSSIKKEDVLTWAKEPEISNIYLEMEGKQLDAYERCLSDMAFEMMHLGELHTKQIQEVIAQMTYLRQISTSLEMSNPELGNHSIKEKWLMEFLENKDNYNGLIVFSWHTSYLKILKNKLEKKGYSVGIINGETKNKTVMQDAFQNGEFDILLGNIQAASKGITLDRADTMVFLDRDWKPDENKQAIERFTATTPDREKLRKVYMLQTSNEFGDIETMDKYMSDVLENKISQTEIVNKFRELLLSKGK